MVNKDKAALLKQPLSQWERSEKPSNTLLWLWAMLAPDTAVLAFPVMLRILLKH